MANRKGQQQPFRKGTARTVGGALSAALSGKTGFGQNVGPGGVVQAASSGPAKGLGAVQTAAPAKGTAAQEAIRQAGRTRAAKKLSDALNAREGGSVQMPPANQSGTKAGSTDPKSMSEVISAKGPLMSGGVKKTNTTTNARAGQEYTERTGSNGKVYHEYIDPKTKKRKVVAFTRRTGPMKGSGQALGA